MHLNLTDLDSGLQSLDLFDVFSIGAVGVVEGRLKFPGVGLALRFDLGNAQLAECLNLLKSLLVLFYCLLTAMSTIDNFRMYSMSNSQSYLPE